MAKNWGYGWVHPSKNEMLEIVRNKFPTGCFINQWSSHTGDNGNFSNEANTDGAYHWYDSTDEAVLAIWDDTDDFRILQDGRGIGWALWEDE